MIIKEYFKMKINEFKVKCAFYGLVAEFMDNQSGIIEMIQSLYESLKDTPKEDLQKEFVKHISELAHEQAVKEREAEKAQ